MLDWKVQLGLLIGRVEINNASLEFLDTVKIDSQVMPLS